MLRYLLETTLNAPIHHLFVLELKCIDNICAVLGFQVKAVVLFQHTMIEFSECRTCPALITLRTSFPTRSSESTQYPLGLQALPLLFLFASTETLALNGRTSIHHSTSCDSCMSVPMISGTIFVLLAGNNSIAEHYHKGEVCLPHLLLMIRNILVRLTCHHMRLVHHPDRSISKGKGNHAPKEDFRKKKCGRLDVTDDLQSRPAAGWSIRE